jgi:Flp pilus assembly protein TadG
MRDPLQRNWERGAVAVEMALVTPLLVVLVFGIIDFSRIFNAELQLSQAAREGARLASIVNGSSGVYTSTQIKNRIESAAPNPAWGGTAATLGATWLCPTGTTVSPSTLPVASVTVTTDFTGILFFTSGKTLTQTAVMRCGG